MTEPEAEALAQASFTYGEVGRTRHDLPAGYHHLRRRRVVGGGDERFDAAVANLMGWNVHRRAGIAVRTSSETVVEAAVAVLRLGWGVAAVRAPVRVVYVVDEPRRKGFAYGTLPGHPERGEEAFMLDIDDDGEVTFTVTAFSRPASPLARLSGPVGRAVQGLVTKGYLRAV